MSAAVAHPAEPGQGREPAAEAGPVPGDELKEACGVFGVYAPGSPVAHLTYLGLYALQHRGQESTGMAVSDGTAVTVVKDMGLVSTVFDDRVLAALPGRLAIGHTRYSTTGSSTWRNAQPVYRGTATAELALGHNGNLVNTEELAEELGMLPGALTSDSDLIAELLAAELGRAAQQAGAEVPGTDPPGAEEPGTGAGDDPAGPGSHLERALSAVLPRLRGAFSLVLMDQQRVIGARDPQGFRPLCLGRLENGWVLASESPALDVVGAQFVRELEPGEVVVIDDSGCRSVHPFEPGDINPRLCLFEFVYFARPDARLYGQNVHRSRVRMGEFLAEQAPADVDLVMGVPESGIPAAEGYARHSGIPYGQGLVKNRYIGRTFIAPTQELRSLGVRMKLNPLRDNIEGKRLVVVDDSIVRGTTTRGMVNMLREAGALEVHLRVSSPPYRWPCFFGMDTGSRDELLAANLSVEEIREYLDVDSLAYLSLDRLIEATGARGAGFCDACVTGRYPVEVPIVLGRADPGSPPSEDPDHAVAEADAGQPVTVAPTLFDQDPASVPAGSGPER